MILDMFQFELLVSTGIAMLASAIKTCWDQYILLAFRMEIDTADGPFYLVETDIVEPLEASTGYRPHPVVRHQKILLPPHENMFTLGEVAVAEVWSLCLFSKRSPRWEPSPVLHIGLLCRTPCFVSRLKGMLGPDDLSFKESSQGRMILRQP